VSGNPTVESGDHLRLIDMPNDPAPLPSGATGTVIRVANLGTDAEQIWMDWDPPYEGRSLMLLPGVDQYEVIP
jgi:hypothetical protein